MIPLYALNKIGAISSFIDPPRMDVERIRHFVEKVHSDVLVTLEQVLPKVEPWLADSTLKKVLVQSPADDLPLLKAIGYRSRMPTVSLPKDNRVEWFRDFAKSGKSGCAKEHPYIKDEPCAYTQTGGTTGTPKGVLLSNDGLNTMAQSFVLSGVDANVGERFLEIMPIFASYGVGCGIHMPLSVGIPLLATTVGIFDTKTGEELGYGEQGEICMTGRNMMLGYYNNEETEHVMRRHEDGTVWVHSGDIGYIDEDGFVFIKGRIKQIIIKFDGHKVFPVTLEAVIAKHEAVSGCAVIGIRDPDHAQGEVPLGIVMLKDGLDKTVDKGALRLELLEMCDRLCEERGRPADIVFTSELLCTGLNEHDYIGLKELYKDHVIQAR